jgi:hypothetical protein
MSIPERIHGDASGKGMLSAAIGLSSMSKRKGAMNDKRSEGTDRDADRSRAPEREREQADELAKRREQAQQAQQAQQPQLTNRERQERWPIG